MTEPALHADRGVLVVVPCLNEETHIESLLIGLLSDPGAVGGLIVVADGGSTDRTREVVTRIAATYTRVRWLDNPKRLQSAAVNQAVKTFGADRRWMVRVDAHATYPSNYVELLLAAQDRTGADTVVVPMRTRANGCFQLAAATAQNSILGNGGARHRAADVGGWVDHGHHALFEIAAYCAAGGYDEAFSHNEDAELDLRLRAAGYRIWLAVEAVLDYYPRASIGKLARQYYNFGSGRARTLVRHHVRMKIRQAVPLLTPPAILLALLTPLHPIFALPLLGWAGACLAAGLLLGAKARKPCAMGAGFAAMVMHLAWAIGFYARVLGGGGRTAQPQPFSPAAGAPTAP
jgi:succinoglycan biosynthesis protein ExoA